MEVSNRMVVVLLLIAAGVLGYAFLVPGPTRQTEPKKAAKASHQPVPVLTTAPRETAQPIPAYSPPESVVKLASANDVLKARQPHLTLPTIEETLRSLPAVEPQYQVSERASVDIQSQLRPTDPQTGRLMANRIQANATSQASDIRGVSHLTATSALVSLVAAQSTANDLSVTLLDGENTDRVTWDIPPQGRAVYVRNTTIKLGFDPAQNTNVLIQLNGKQYVNAVGVQGDENQILLPLLAEMPVQLSPGTQTTITVKSATGITLRNVIVITPTLLEPATPLITSVANGTYASVKPFPPASPLKCYGSEAIVRMEGQNGAPGELSFILLDDAGMVLSELTNAKINTVNSLPGGWTAEFNLPNDAQFEPGTFGRILLLRKQNGKHSFAKSALAYSVNPFTPNVAAPTFNATLTSPANKNPSTAGVYQVNKTEIDLNGTSTIPDDAQVVVVSDRDVLPLGSFPNSSGSAQNSWQITLKPLQEGDQQLTSQIWQGNQLLAISSAPIKFSVRTTGPDVTSLKPDNFGTAPGVFSLTVSFDSRNPIDVGSKVTDPTTYSLFPSKGTGVFDHGTTIAPTASGVSFDPARNAVILSFNPADIKPDIYELQIVGANIQDIFGNSLEGISGKQGSNYVKKLGGAGGVAGFVPDETPTVMRGISGSTGPYVPFTEFTGPRDVPNGFNPNDKVETRVVRLYYYRDAHRVAQIVNRKVKSYNRQGVDMARQLADKARNTADQLTAARQDAERNAILKAEKTRKKENELKSAEQSLNSSIQELSSYRRANPQADPAADPTIQQFQSLINSFNNQAGGLRKQVEDLRDDEAEANEQAQQAEAQEKLARDDQFRREVAAAHTDPDTYVPGVPKSNDPVEQVSVSVVGEGLLQLRGPLKGINQIRTMVDQLDAPVGQVRISVHSVQINGEKAENMEIVAKRIQQYIDQARFLTAQSAEMLRKAVVQVASRKAEEARALYPGDTQEDRDQRYLHAFFGQDFINELRTIDSEFLHTENKLLSLHSMDTTSLSSALNLMALAKNSTRNEIFMEFDSMLQSELPQAEMRYLEAGQICEKKKFPHRHCKEEILTLGQNANFESLRGFFNTQVGDNEIMTPLQREFIRLAQIFKNRLITEMEYKQRVTERAIIEERLGDRIKELRDARDRENTANEALEKLESSTVEQRVGLITLINEVGQDVKLAVDDELAKFIEEIDALEPVLNQLKSVVNAKGTVELDGKTIKFSIQQRGVEKLIKFENETDGRQVKQNLRVFLDKANEIFATLDLLYQLGGESAFDNNPVTEAQWQSIPASMTKLQQVFTSDDEIDQRKASLFIFTLDDFKKYLDGNSQVGLPSLILESLASAFSQQLGDLLQSLAHDDSNDENAGFAKWIAFKKNFLNKILEQIDLSSASRLEINRKIKSTDDDFHQFMASGVRLQFAKRRAGDSRRPLDHKKFLDMLIDELEEKYIELLDGTRAQTANVDNYLKRITTALDDDFNRQFYYPTFRYVRETSQMRDVQFGQTETTTILANNREFAKVDPSATMEFDLPKRDILLTEGINSAKALMDDVGALANDPTFLAMASMKSGQGNSPGAGSTGGNTVVRSVLPGLSTSTSEQVMSQNSNGGNQFGSNLENLIPDPAIYKFETGTGYEIRPVIQPDGQAVVFDFNYMYTTNIREPVRADEKHLGRVKRHYVDTDVQLSNFELREVSRYTIALKASRTSRGVPLLEDIPVAGVLFRPLPSDEKSLQQNLIMAQATIFPTLFDLMGLRWAPVVADMDPLRMSNQEFIVRNRRRVMENRVYDEASSYVDKFMRIPDSERRMDLYRSQETIPALHPNGYQGPGMNLRDSQMQEGYQPNRAYPKDQFYPGSSREGARFRPGREYGNPPGTYIEEYPLEMNQPTNPLPAPVNEPVYEEGSRRRLQFK